MATENRNYDAAWLLARLRSDRSALELIAAMIEEQPQDITQALRARRSLEGMLAGGSGGRIDGAAYSEAAVVAAADGNELAARTLRTLAATEHELTRSDQAWRMRYAERPRTKDDVIVATLLGTGTVQCSPDEGMPGVDGAWYQEADFFEPKGAAAEAKAEPVVVVTTTVPTIEIVGPFGSAAERYAWLSDRSLSRPGTALTSSAAGPDCRLAHEERALEWLLHLGLGERDPWPGLRADMFSTDSRSEIFLAWRGLESRTVRRYDWLVEAELMSRLLRAPAWATESIGAQGSLASTYLYRLAHTPVSRTDAEISVRFLFDADGVPMAGRYRDEPAPQQVSAERQTSSPLSVALPQPRLSPEGPVIGGQPTM
jgi:hypothetical protein